MTNIPADVGGLPRYRAALAGRSSCVDRGVETVRDYLVVSPTASYQRALRDYDPAYSNSVILMTDGANDDPGSISLDRLVRDLERARSPKRPVRIIGIGISDDADYPALRRIAEATGGQAYSADTPEDILGVFAKAIASR